MRYDLGSLAARFGHRFCLVQQMSTDFSIWFVVFVWYGSEANKIERGAAAKFATDYKNEVRKSAPKVAYVGKQSSTLEKPQQKREVSEIYWFSFLSFGHRTFHWRKDARAVLAGNRRQG